MAKINSGNLKQRRKQLFDKFRANPKLWIERCLSVVDEKGNEVPFKLNNVQAAYYEVLKAKYWKPYKQQPDGTQIYRFQGIREIIQKGRQIGLSTFINALLLHDSLFFRNTKTYIFCQDDEKSKEMLRDKIKHFWGSLPKEDPLVILPRVVTDNESLLSFSIKSYLKAHTPGSSSGVARKKGRSVTVRNALMSEMAEWEDAETLWQGLAPAMRDPSTNIFIESSPYPRKSGPFYRDMYEQAKAGENGWNARFFAWFEFEKNVQQFESEEHRASFEASLSDFELELQRKYDLPLERLLWRRYMVGMFGGGERGAKKFQADYPSNDREGFESNDDGLFFDECEVDVRQLLAEPQEPIPGRMYAITVDPAEGSGGDNIVIKVADVQRRAEVHSWRSNRMSISRVHWKLYEIWLKYPGLIGIESNSIGQTVIAMARLIKDPFFQKMIYCDTKGRDGLRTGTNKEAMLFDLRDNLEEAVKAYADDPSKEPEVPVGYRLAYPDTIQEMDHFQDLGDGKYGAKPGGNRTDDSIMASAIMIVLLRLAHRAEKRFSKYYPDREKYRVKIGSLDEGDNGED